MAIQWSTSHGPYGIKVRYRLQGISRPTSMALDIIKALIDLIDLIHLCGYSLDGHLALKNLYWLPNSKMIKISGLVIGQMVKKNKSRIKGDFASMHNFIRDCVFAGSKVPGELKTLMKLMITDPIMYGNLIRDNIMLLNDESKVGRYISLHQKLTRVRKIDEQMYLCALTYLKCGRCDRTQNWQIVVLYNSALASVFEREDAVYPADDAGVSWYGCNCCHHVLDHSVGYENNKVIKFTFADIFPMLECFIPGLFAELEEALFAIIEIHYSQELRSLSAYRAPTDLSADENAQHL
uniref:Uncharacterized protein n=1 Tax=Arundo donax TaxID=35708 RepID=A0A0A9CKV5_ARUDO